MSDIVRFGISIPADLIASFDQFTAERHYTNRSEAIRDLIRDKLVKREWDAKIKGKKVIGTITSVYDHHNCLEVIIVRGESEKVRQLADKINALKGIKHSRLTMTTSGLDLK